MHTIKLPNGKRTSVGQYVRAWKRLKHEIPATDSVPGFHWFPVDAWEVLREMRYGMHDRINQHLSWHGQGRKWDSNYQRELIQAAHRINEPRLIIDWLPPDLKSRFSHRLRENREDL